MPHFVSNAKVLCVTESLGERFSKAVALKGTRGFHRFSPAEATSLVAFQLSSAVTGRHPRVSRIGVCHGRS